MPANTTNNRCPNCGAPLRQGQQALDCEYCSTEKLASLQSRSAPVAEKQPWPLIKTNARIYLAAFILSLILIYVTGKKNDTLLHVFGAFCFISFYTLLGSLLWYGFRKARFWYYYRRN